jgi:hypothetical protein
MNTGKFVLAQLLDWIHPQQFQRCVERYGGNRKVSRFTCWQQFVCMVFAQLTWREGLRDIEACLNSRPAQLYHLGLRGPIHRTTLADANEQRDWRIYADLAQGLLAQARVLYAQDPLQLELSEAVYALDASAIELSLRLCPWARYSHCRSAVKLHTQLDLRGWLPAAVQITPAKRSDVTWLDLLDFEPGAFYLLDRGYVDFKRLQAIQQAGAWFVTRTKANLAYWRCASRRVDYQTGLRSDQTIQLTSWFGRHYYPDRLRRVRYYAAHTKRHLVFLTNHMDLPPLLVAQLYQQRWQVELFFRWLKQHLRIKAFYGRSENAVRTQLWIALCVYALVAIARKQIKSQASLFEILQILSINVFDKTPINELFAHAHPPKESTPAPNQLSLFN